MSAPPDEPSPAEVRQVILAAVALAGPMGPGWRTHVNDAVTQIGTLLTERAHTYRHAALFLSAASYSTEIVELEHEPSSTRVIVHLQSDPSRWAKNGRETARTYRTDAPAGRAQQRALEPLIGRRCRVWIGHEGDDGYRVLLHAVAIDQPAQSERQ
jgi:hypothetical protein